MKKSGASQAQPASELITKRIAELADWRVADEHALIEASLERGAPDNVTVVLVYASEPTMLVLAGQGSAG